MLSRYWWVLLLRGILAILFGVAAFIWPGPTIAVLVLLFGAYALVDGIFAVIAGIQQYRLRHPLHHSLVPPARYGQQERSASLGHCVGLPLYEPAPIDGG
jgi:hypothetical protein